MTSWREVWQIHPAANLFPLMERTECVGMFLSRITLMCSFCQDSCNRGSW